MANLYTVRDNDHTGYNHAVEFEAGMGGATRDMHLFQELCKVPSLPNCLPAHLPTDLPANLLTYMPTDIYYRGVHAWGIRQ
jgi:hypothetical protein